MRLTDEYPNRSVNNRFRSIASMVLRSSRDTFLLITSHLFSLPLWFARPFALIPDMTPNGFLNLRQFDL
jgi:hypothetical protein